MKYAEWLRLVSQTVRDTANLSLSELREDYPYHTDYDKGISPEASANAAILSSEAQ